MKKNERTFKGTSYKGLQASETACNIAEKLGVEIQADTYQDLDTIISSAWDKVKSQKYSKLNIYDDYRPNFSHNNSNGIITKIEFSNGLKVVHIPVSTKKQTEQAGYVRYKSRIYCPQLDLHLGADSITTFIQKCISFENKLKKLGIL